jgi:NAD(P)H-dependent FMN reductase
VGFVSYGGLSGGLRAVEQLRPVFAELHAVTIRDSVAFPGIRFGADGEPLDTDAVELAAATMLEQLTWWGLVLRDARERSPYLVG